MTPQALEELTAAVPSGRVVRYIRWFNEIGIDDVPLVGGKNASLGEMYRELATTGVKVPNGFAVTARHIATSCERRAWRRKSKRYP